ncbi:MAG: hypothetical protein KC493_13730 [Bacteriovoracaceae bacterium]|nr:hypothetical protein [Bacteriovoracaceae bacterium]
MKILAFLLLLTSLSVNAGLNLPDKDQLLKDVASENKLEGKGELSLLKATLEIENSSVSIDGKCNYLIKSLENKDFYENIKAISKNPESLKNSKCDLSGLNSELEEEEGWNFSFHFGFNRTHYQNTDMELESSRMNVVVRDFEFRERTSAGYYNPANWEQFQDAFRWIDEPTNSFILSVEKKGHSIILSIFHPKFLKENNQIKHVTGTVDGVDVDDFMAIDEEFDGYNNQPGEMYLVRFENTHLQMEWSLGYGYDLKLIDSDKFGTLSVRPEVFLGMMTGGNLTVYTKEGTYWDYEDYKQPMEVQGVMYSAGLRVNYQIRNFNFFAEGKTSVAHMNHGFMDGTAKYKLEYSAVTVGVGYTFKKKKKKKKKPLF